MDQSGHEQSEVGMLAPQGQGLKLLPYCSAIFNSVIQNSYSSSSQHIYIPARGKGMVFSILLKQRQANYHPGTKSDLLPVCVNKVLLEHSHTHLFMYCLFLLSYCNGGGE